MPLTLADAGRLSQDVLVKGIIETIITESAVLRYLPFMTLNGNSLRYNRELTLGSIDFYAVGDTWNEDVMTVQEKTSSLKIMGGDADVDEFLQQTYSNVNNLRALAIEKKAKQMAYTFNDTFFNGDSVGNPLQFDGLKTMAAGSRTFDKGVNGATLALDHMDELIDYIKPGKPDVLFMSRRSRRKLSALRRASGNLLETTMDAFGRRVTMYDGIPIEIDDNILDNESRGTSTDCSSIYGVKFGFETGLCGLDNGGIQVVPIGNLETKDAWRTRIKWYVSLALFRDLSLIRLEGVRP
jgi:HK97 family phage major capsid protein